MTHMFPYPIYFCILGNKIALYLVFYLNSLSAKLSTHKSMKSKICAFFGGAFHNLIRKAHKWCSGFVYLFCLIRALCQNFLILHIREHMREEHNQAIAKKAWDAVSKVWTSMVLLSCTL